VSEIGVPESSVEIVKTNESVKEVVYIETARLGSRLGLGKSVSAAHGDPEDDGPVAPSGMMYAAQSAMVTSVLMMWIFQVALQALKLSHRLH